MYIAYICILTPCLALLVAVVAGWIYNTELDVVGLMLVMMLINNQDMKVPVIAVRLERRRFPRHPDGRKSSFGELLEDAFGLDTLQDGSGGFGQVSHLSCGLSVSTK